MSPFICQSLGPFQSGFRPSHSIKSILNSISNGVLSHFSIRSFVLLVLLDMCSAFNFVNHSIFCDSNFRDLLSLGVFSSAPSLFSSCLTGHTYSVIIQSSESVTSPFYLIFSRAIFLDLFCLTVICLPFAPLLHYYSIPFHNYADDVQFFIPSH